ncbi:Lrp/AsnC family transcriptional regulator [Actinoallomurus rhizosphaericola]|uniref:Lrp/AsnC family transcriptional regulator n=1 Tax=Actinoallomurus rhizosphaericola TaxID=2952536 RepID=UPI0020936114|nr:AsnC family transcriptional regulator [Actinoallomurus rhizosphaericola]MCO6000332.1 Lrp/AsnC family transcriptional regulator [Actinoallomurus rhizosphaericola]
MEILDLQLVHALYVDGRASFRRIAGVLDVSEQTVARRYRRLRETGAVRVVGRLDSRYLGHVEEWVMRLRCAPRATLPVAQALARRSDAYRIRLASGGTEIVCHIQTPDQRARDKFLLDELPATRQVTSIAAHQVLRLFRGGTAAWHAPISSLTPEQVARLTPPPSDPEPFDLDDGDRLLLSELAHDGRMHHAALSASTGWHESTVRRRIARLRASGALYFGVDFDEHLLGYSSHTILWISVNPAALDAAGTALARHPQIAYAAATTGPTNLMATAFCTGSDTLYDFITGHVGSLPGIQTIQTAPVLRIVKRAALT